MHHFIIDFPQSSIFYCSSIVESGERAASEPDPVQNESVMLALLADFLALRNIGCEQFIFISIHISFSINVTVICLDFYGLNFAGLLPRISPKKLMSQP